ncbi:putative MFS family arabinose efflux permease [Palleronia aestuarii]|uniref:Putative MFS family arabinose efflux permease n=1 Tax=Palleronia aestuarii TaxID=568105 RepID=A0A2W7NK47_9RHOB|nr:MFS transporter [Palleronia aestuarii]PZX17074.1 putative MFS family arabinose efflux permease [Palleronia aestuarii]
MLKLVSAIWALLIGVFLIQVGNGMQSTLMGVRGQIEGFSTLALSLVTSGYFMGFLVGSRISPSIIRRVGHVRAFAALGSLMSAVLIAYPLITEPVSWTILRAVLGFCMSGIYVVAESWLNDRATNETRGTLLSAYMVSQMAGMVAAQGLMNVGDAAGAKLFILASILVSLAFTPVLLSAVPLPAAEAIKPMTLRALFRRSPLATVGTALLGGIFAAQMGMAAIYAAQIGLGVREVSTFVAALFAGSFLLQVPVGRLSDLMDRRFVILTLAVVGAVACGTTFVFRDSYLGLIVGALLAGGTATPLYSLFIAYMNDHLEREDMPAAASGIVFIYGLGAISGPLVIGQAMEVAGPHFFWVVLMTLFGAIAVYTAYRMTRREAPATEDSAYLGVLPTSSEVAVSAAYEWYADEVEERSE